MKSVLDTSVVLMSALPNLQGNLAVSSATLAELHFGVLVTEDPETRAERLRRLALIEHLFHPLPVDDRVARSYGQLAAAIVAAGQRPRARVMDLLIAATAHAHDARLYTANFEDLRGLEDLLDIEPV